MIAIARISKAAVLGAAAFLFAAAGPLEIPANWTAPVAPFAVTDEIAYVGTEDLASYLIDTGSGLILIDAPMAENAALLEQNIAALGHTLSDVKIILITHAHFDHVGGVAKLRADTGARLLVSARDGALIAAGGKGDFHWGDALAYPTVAPDGEVIDGQKITLGAVTLTAHLTPGHTKGCTSWTMTAHVKGKPYNLLLTCSTSVPGYNLLNEPQYPNIIADYRASFKTLKALPCDILLAPHGSFIGLTDKRVALKAQPDTNPFVDPALCKRHFAYFEDAFNNELAKELAAKPAP